MKYLLTLLTTLLLITPLFAAKKGDKLNSISYNEEKYALLQDVKKETAQQQAKEEKSGLKATLLSAVLPGAGQYYTESYWRTALYAVIEIAAITGYFVYEKKGDDEDKVMRAFGDKHWSEQRYWSKVYSDAKAANLWQHGDLNLNGQIISDGDYTAETISRLRTIERSGNLSHYTHHLPSTKTQQYYEMIYKYLGQFGAGWLDLEDWAYYDTAANRKDLTASIRSYRTMRNNSNDYYKNATTMANVVLVNHLVSAIDAAFTVKYHNKQVRYSLQASQQYYAGENVAMYGISVAW